MINYYIHQIGDISNEKTYKRLTDILKSKMICSRGYLERHGNTFDYDNPSFELDASENRAGIYYEEDIHKDKVSLSDPQNRFIKKAIECKDHQIITCFDYRYVAFAISRDIPTVPREETRGLALGEVQVQDKIDSQYIVGLILPITEAELQGQNIDIVNMIAEICRQNGMPLDIYNYEGLLIYEKPEDKCIKQ